MAVASSASTVTPPTTFSPTRVRIDGVLRQKHVHARSELHHTEPIARLHDVALPDPADDAPREDADDLATTITLPVVIDRRPRCTR